MEIINSYFKKLWSVLDTLNEQELKIELGGTVTGLEYKQEFLNLVDNHLYEIIITRAELKLDKTILKDKIIHKIKNEKVRA